MKYSFSTISLFISLNFLINACGPITIGPAKDPGVIENTQLKKSGFREIKLISSEIAETRNKKTFSSSEYNISQESRLLLRVSELRNIDPQIINLYPVIIRISLRNQAASTFSQSIKVCPIMTNWMMLATWKFAHPYKNGDWQNAGGDFDSPLCISSLNASELSTLPSEEKVLCDQTDVICFDIRSILSDLYRINKLNYGFILTNESENHLSIFGDISSQQPLFIWRQLH